MTSLGVIGRRGTGRWIEVYAVPDQWGRDRIALLHDGNWYVGRIDLPSSPDLLDRLLPWIGG